MPYDLGAAQYTLTFRYAQVLQVCWDGKLVHLCSLLQSAAAPALLGALADRLLIATRASKDGEQGMRGEQVES